MTTKKDANEKIREVLSELEISRSLNDLVHRGEEKATFANQYEPNLSVIVEHIKDAGYKFFVQYYIPGLGFCNVRCNNIIGRHSLAVEIIAEIVQFSDLAEYEQKNTIKDILDMEIDSIRFLPEALIDKKLFGDIFEKFDEAVEEVFGKKKYVSSSINSNEVA